MEMTFKLEVFEGPLDLLLHLIDINKIDIYDIPIAMITDQYMDYIHRMQIEDMDVTSDFLVMAATLLRIKSKMLLPVEKADAEETGEDPRMELVNRLLEYKTYKYIIRQHRFHWMRFLMHYLFLIQDSLFITDMSYSQRQERKKQN